MGKTIQIKFQLPASFIYIVLLLSFIQIGHNDKPSDNVQIFVHIELFLSMTSYNSVKVRLNTRFQDTATV